MKFIILLITLIFTNIKLVNSNEVEVIELHKTKNLDQLVLEQMNVSDTDQNLNDNSELEEDELNEISNSEVVTVDDIIYTDNLFTNSELNTIKSYLDNIDNLQTDILKNELFVFLKDLNFDFNIDKNKETFYLIVNYFYNSGNISHAYQMIKNRDLKNDIYLSYYTTIEINYLLSTFQLEKVCNFKQTFNNNIDLENYLLEKLDIFCSILDNKNLEADLLNSILIETETKLDSNFQLLYKFLSNDNFSDDIKINFKETINLDLIFLYSAMARIAEIPLDENFLKIDPFNLSIPIILNRSTPINTRIKAANNSFINNGISAQSLAALYQSVDFNSNQLNNPEETILNLNSDLELLMAYYFQLINIQIFPSERIQALSNFWTYAKEHNLETIAYSLTYNIVKSFEISSDFLNFAPEISESFLYNEDFDKAETWIDFYENSLGEDQKSKNIRILLSLYSSDNIDDMIKYLIDDSSNILNSNSKNNEELFFIVLNLLDQSNILNLPENFSSIYDERLMPSIFISTQIKSAIEKDEENMFLIYSLISINNKNWNEIHPEHLQLLLSGFIKYKDGKIIKKLLIEIFKSYKIL